MHASKDRCCGVWSHSGMKRGSYGCDTYFHGELTCARYIHVYDILFCSTKGIHLCFWRIMFFFPLRTQTQIMDFFFMSVNTV